MFITAQPHELVWYAAITNVAILRFPEQADERDRLDRQRWPRLLLLNVETEAPTSSSCLEDWMRVPATDGDVRLRIANLEARFARHAPSPTLDAAGQLTFRGDYVFVTPREAAIAGELVRRFRTVVSDTHLIAQAWPDGDGTSDRLRAVVHRLRKRIGELGLTIATVRNQGHILHEVS
jgi:hypothetical protein